MAKGDTIRVHVRGLAYPIEVKATKAGRKLVQETDKDAGLQWFLIHEKTWTDKTVKTTRFAAADVVAIEDDTTTED